MKRSFDFTIATLLILLFLPLIIVLSLLVKFRMGSPVFFTQERPGKYGKPFKMIKFRSMTNARDSKGELLPGIKRLTPFGRWLRSTSMDELPELINVLRGDMSLVGPRPLRMDYLSLYNDFQRRRHEVRPGITGWAQVNGRNSLDWTDKFNLDVWYVDNRSIWLDIRILFRTLNKVILRKDISKQKDFTPKFKGNK